MSLYKFWKVKRLFKILELFTQNTMHYKTVNNQFSKVLKQINALDGTDKKLLKLKQEKAWLKQTIDDNAQMIVEQTKALNQRWDNYNSLEELYSKKFEEYQDTLAMLSNVRGFLKEQEQTPQE